MSNPKKFIQTTLNFSKSPSSRSQKQRPTPYRKSKSEGNPGQGLSTTMSYADATRKSQPLKKTPSYPPQEGYGSSVDKGFGHSSGQRSRASPTAPPADKSPRRDDHTSSESSASLHHRDSGQGWKSQHGESYSGSDFGTQSSPPGVGDFSQDDEYPQSPDLDDGAYSQSFSQHSQRKRSHDYEAKVTGLEQLQRSHKPGQSVEDHLPPLRASQTHKVFFKVPPSDRKISKEELLQPFPRDYMESGGLQEHNTVLMPCSERNEENKSRWRDINTVLKEALTCSYALEEAILSYNVEYAHRWSFQALHRYFENKIEKERFFQETFEFMRNLALRLPEVVTKPVPLLKQGQSKKLTLTQEQVACLLANAFFCTFPKRNRKVSILPDINFSNLFGRDEGPRKDEKFKCIFNYFERIQEKMPTGTITYSRQVLDKDKTPDWKTRSELLTELCVMMEGTIEDEGVGMLQVDFANKYVGGGVLGRGLVQEEIRFILCPEMIVSRLFTEVLQDNEVLIMTGCERFSHYTGYADTFMFDSDYRDNTPSDSWGRKCTEVVAMDALHFYDPKQQYYKDKIDRELNKAFCAFKGSEPRNKLPAVATGNWGCGAFKGDKQLKALLQVMAASVAGRQVAYFTFGDEELSSQLTIIHAALREQQIRVGELYEHILSYRKRTFNFPKRTLFDYIRLTLSIPSSSEAPDTP